MGRKFRRKNECVQERDEHVYAGHWFRINATTEDTEKAEHTWYFFFLCVRSVSFVVSVVAFKIMHIMPKTDALEQSLDRLKQIEVDPATPAAHKELAHALAKGHSAAAAKAARIVLKAQLVDLVDDLSRAFERFLKNGESTDKGCDAKLAIATALYELGKGEAELFLKGVRHVQMEPVWGKSVDTAAELRGVCGLGLVRCGYRDALGELADLLADADARARIAAARGIAYAGHEYGAYPLRTKTLLGDAEPEVTGECMIALLRLSAAKYVPFVARFLDSPDAILREQAVSAIGQARHPAAFELLRERWEATIDPAVRRLLLPAIAALRIEASLAFLLDQIDAPSAGAARDAIEAMTAYRGDPAVRAKVETIVKERDNEIVTETFRKMFGK